MARRGPASLVVDGDLVDWNLGRFSVAPPTFFGDGTTFTEEGRVTSNDDQSAQLFFAYRAGELLMAAAVRDDDVQSKPAGEQWRGDGLELLVPRRGAPMLHLGVNPVGDVHVFSKGADKDIRAAAQLVPGGWHVEVRIPFSALGLTGREASVPLNIAMRDVDAADSVPAHRVWSGQRHGLPASAGTLLLDVSPPPASTWPTCAPWKGVVSVRAPLTVKGRALMAGAAPVVLRMVNFQSARANWQTFWTSFDEAQIRRDLDSAQRLRANAVRLFVFDAAFGIPEVKPQMLERLRFVVREAASRGILSVVSFFPFKKEFRREWYGPMREHLEAVVSAFRGDPSIAMWDLMNEPDHAWALSDGGVTVSDVSNWATEMAKAVRAVDPTHLVTVGQAGHFIDAAQVTPENALPFVDVQSVHWYGEPDSVKSWFQRATERTSGAVVLQEVGTTNLFFSEAEASSRLDAVCAEAAKHGFAGVGYWELFDHPVGSMAHQTPRWSESVENDFGLLTADGRPKQQAASFCRCLAVPQLRVERPATAK
ncbi:MAG: cellulase family glycosylhydrolase [Archangium sp.]|nr:cellulase family glycosylhydrolase [Archangium sp.]